MAVPKKRTTKTKKGMRRSHHGAVAVTLSKCVSCGESRKPHVACASCGVYKK